MHMEGGGGGTSCFFVTGSNGVCGKHGHRLKKKKKKKHIQQHYWHETEASVYTEGLTVCGIIYHKCIKAENATLRVCKSSSSVRVEMFVLHVKWQLEIPMTVWNLGGDGLPASLPL